MFLCPGLCSLSLVFQSLYQLVICYMRRHFLLTGKSEKVQPYSSDIGSVAPRLGGVIDGSFIANVKIRFPFFLFWHINILVLHSTSWHIENNRALMCLMALHQSWSVHHCHRLGWQEGLNRWRPHAHHLVNTEKIARAREYLPVQHPLYQHLLSTCRGKA